MIIFLFIILLSSVGVRSEEKADTSESEDNVSISLSLSRLCQGKADTSGQRSCLNKEEKEKITGLSDKIADIQAQQSKMMKTIAKLEKNVLENLGAEMKELLKHIKTIQLSEFPATIQPTEPPTESPTSSMPKCGKTELIETDRNGSGARSQEPGASSIWGDCCTAPRAFTSDDDYWWAPGYQLPATIWMRFPRAHRLAAIGYKNRDQTYDPKSLKVIGSNDCATWTTLLTVDNTGFTKAKEFRKWCIPVENQQMFSCLGFMWQSKAPVTHETTVVVEEIRMWEAV